MISRNSAVLIIAAILSANGLAEETGCALAELESGEAYVVRADDTAKQIKHWDFQSEPEKLQGWKSEQDEQYKPWNVCVLVAEGFRGAKSALKTTVPNTWQCLGTYVDVEYAGNDAKVTVMYKAK